MADLTEADRAMTTVHAPLVYYARLDDRIKIGTTINIRRRLTAQGIDQLLAVEPGSYDLENERLAQFAEHRLSPRRGPGRGSGRGPAEWFRPGASLMTHIEALRAVYALPAIRTWTPSPTGAPQGREYHNLHRRMARQRGKASLHRCAQCGGQAAHWAQLHDTSGWDIWDDYVPMCIQCHRAYDLGGRPKSAEHREQLSLYALNHRTPEHLRKISEALTGRIGIGMTGRHHSEETRRKMRAAQPNLGKKVGPRSPEIRRQISETLRARWAEKRAARDPT
jgi:NUMOD3 motif